MTGLEKIVGRIGDESSRETSGIIAEAHAEADRIIEEATRKAEEEEKRIIAESEAESAAIVSRAESAAALSKKQQLLEAKGEVIEEVFEEALRSLCNLPEKDYFSMIRKMIIKYGRREFGKIMFSKRDIDRMPFDFKTALPTMVEGGRLELDSRMAEISGGFILRYGDIEENCSFEAILKERREELQEEVQKILF
ncbi:MAG: hypothetical protein K5985_00075 [Lachnospiraceae bacterium]|nr:hypothetical protein [Lachnospiraceae bacterium]